MKHSADVIKALRKGQSLGKLGFLGRRDGRIDCAGLVLDPVKPTGRTFLRGFFAEIKGVLELKRLKLEGIDFTGARLDNLYMDECVIENCVFDDAVCRYWHLHGCSFVDCSFRGADLRHSVLGGVNEERSARRNSYVRVRFKASDLRETVYRSATFRECVFEHCKLDKVDFQGTVFEDSRFVGELKEVMFHRHAFRGENYPENTMLRVDFSDASFEHVEFRNLDLESVIFPTREGMVEIHDWRKRLQSALNLLAEHEDIGARKVRVLLEHKLEWSGPAQRRGVLDLSQIRKLVGEARTTALMPILLGADASLPSSQNPANPTS